MELLFLVCGVVVGVIVTIVVSRMRRAGSLVINVPDTDDPPYLSADLDLPVAFISKKKYVTFKVDIHHLRTHQ